MTAIRQIAIAASLAASFAAAHATAPATATATDTIPMITSITAGDSFAAYTGSAPVGSGKVNVNNTLFYIDEKTVGGLESYYIFFDPKNHESVDATVTFDGAISQIFTTKSGLDGTNATYGAPSVTYTTSTFIGLEPGQDSASFSGDTLHLHLNAIDPGDHLRVLVATPPVPEPGTYALFGIGMLALFVAKRRRNRA